MTSKTMLQAMQQCGLGLLSSLQSFAWCVYSLLPLHQDLKHPLTLVSCLEQTTVSYASQPSPHRFRAA